MGITSGVYLLGMWTYTLGVKVASLFGGKARLLNDGRRETWAKLSGYDNKEKSVWVHAASLGEFEQGRPIIEAIRKANPGQRIVLTFYSPSGYEVRKNYKGADLVCYLPADGPGNARRFVEGINPSKVYFVKYEFWHFFLKAIKEHKAELYGVSMIFRPEQPFFKWWGGWFRDMLHKFDRIFVQDNESAELLRQKADYSHTTTTGDTRFDRVAQIVSEASEVETAKRFVEGAERVIVAGSTWPPDEKLIVDYINKSPEGTKLIIAPHEIGEERVRGLCESFKVGYSLFTEPKEDLKGVRVLVVNTIGLLSAIYRYGDVTYVGGGFGVGIHNTLEPATYGLPVVFGPKHQKFKEAVDLVSCGGGFSISTKEEFCTVMDRLLTDETAWREAGKAADTYCKSKLGATETILRETYFGR